MMMLDSKGQTKSGETSLMLMPQMLMTAVCRWTMFPFKWSIISDNKQSGKLMQYFSPSDTL